MGTRSSHIHIIAFVQLLLLMLAQVLFGALVCSSAITTATAVDSKKKLTKSVDESQGKKISHFSVEVEGDDAGRALVGGINNEKESDKVRYHKSDNLGGIRHNQLLGGDTIGWGMGGGMGVGMGFDIGDDHRYKHRHERHRGRRHSSKGDGKGDNDGSSKGNDKGDNDDNSRENDNGDNDDFYHGGGGGGGGGGGNGNGGGGGGGGWGYP